MTNFVLLFLVVFLLGHYKRAQARVKRLFSFALAQSQKETNAMIDKVIVDSLRDDFRSMRWLCDPPGLGAWVLQTNIANLEAVAMKGSGQALLIVEALLLFEGKPEQHDFVVRLVCHYQLHAKLSPHALEMLDAR